MRKRRMMSRAQIIAAAERSTEGNLDVDRGTVSVKEAAKFLSWIRGSRVIVSVSPRRVRALINPECNCVIRKRIRRIKPSSPDVNCTHCGGTGHVEQRLRAEIRDGNEYKGYRITPDDLFEYDSHRKPTGRPPGSTLS